MPTRAAAADDDLAALANPLAGTTTGSVFPGADTPFGMVQYSPNTDNPHGGGYNSRFPRTWGFATTHLSGPGCAAMGDVVSLPTAGPVSSVDAHRQESGFSHSSEDASPGYYGVTLDASQVRAELTATTRTGWARYAYPATAQANVIVDPGANLRGVRASDVEIAGDNRIEGSVTTWGYWNACPARAWNQYTVYFSMEFDRPFKAFGTGNGSRLDPGGRAARGPDAGAWVSFDAAADRRPVVSKVGISFVDLRGARRNLHAETSTLGFDFDKVRAIARAAWNGVLGRIEVSGADDARRTFYSALYHTLLHPNVFSDADGRYTGFDNRVHTVPAGRAHYTSFSMWDTYRSAHQVIDLVDPERVPDMMRSLIDDARQGGWLPKWPYAHYYTNEMVGDPAANVLADAYLKGLLRRGDVPAAYAALMHNATDVPDPARSPFEGRTGLEDYLNLGYVPFHHSGDYSKSASINMEYGVNDCALALMAGGLGEEADRRLLLRRAKRFRYSLHGGFVHPRLSDGSWIEPFDPAAGTGFKEGSSWQYTWLAPQDVRDLASAMGGRDAAVAKLDQFFGYQQIAQDASAARTAWKGSSRFDPRNEVSLHAPYLYNYLGQPWKTQDVVRGVETLFSSARDGLPWSDDLGALSGWYVLSALGLYPATAGDQHYTLTAPLFEHSVIHLSGARQAFVIDAPGASRVDHVRGVTFDGRPLATSVVSHNDLVRGGRLAFALGSTPNYRWANGKDAPRSACSDNPATADVRLRLGHSHRSGHATVIRTRLRNVGDASATGIALHLRLPRGWRARARSGTRRGLLPRRSSTQTWVLHGPRRRVGPVRADATWASAGGRGAALRTFATGRARLAR